MTILSGARVLITRATGFLGKYVTAAVSTEGGETLPVSRSLGCDLRNPAMALETVLLGHPDIVIHLCSARRWTDGTAGDLFREEVQMGLNVIHAAACAQAKMVLVSKAWGALSRENDAPWSLGSMLRAYAAQYKLPWTWIVVPDLYGPGEMPNGDPSRPVANILGVFAKSAKEGTKKAVLPGTGKEPLGLLFAADAARGIALAAASALKSDCVQMPETDKLEAEKLAAEVVGVSGYPGEVSWDASKAGYPCATSLDPAAIEALGWKPQMALKDGLAATARWFVETQSGKKP
jgi:nucleoside-diphosphate-sugar epimerase